MRAKRITLIVATIAVLLVALRASLPSLAKDYLNHKLAQMGDYSGHISAVDIDLWRGAYTLMDVTVTKTSTEIPVPLFQVDSAELSISWSALWHGAVVAEIDFYRPELNFVDDVQLGRQSGTGTDWQQALQRLTPVEINRLALHQGAIHFRNFSSDPPVDIVLAGIEGTIDNITNVDRSAGAQQARLSITGTMLEDAKTSLQGQLDPLGDFQDFSLRLKITGIDLRQLGTLSEAYGNFDFESGNGDFLLELQAENGRLEGYAKPLLDNVVILDLDEDLEQGPFSAAWEALVGALGRLFRNQPENRIASRIEIRGNLDQQDISGWQAFISILRNAFVDAYEATFDSASSAELERGHQRPMVGGHLGELGSRRINGGDGDVTAQENMVDTGRRNAAGEGVARAVSNQLDLDIIETVAQHPAHRGSRGGVEIPAQDDRSLAARISQPVFAQQLLGLAQPLARPEPEMGIDNLDFGPHQIHRYPQGPPRFAP